MIVRWRWPWWQFELSLIVVELCMYVFYFKRRPRPPRCPRRRRRGTVNFTTPPSSRSACRVRWWCAGGRPERGVAVATFAAAAVGRVGASWCCDYYSDALYSRRRTSSSTCLSLTHLYSTRHTFPVLSSTLCEPWRAAFSHRNGQTFARRCHTKRAFPPCACEHGWWDGPSGKNCAYRCDIGKVFGQYGFECVVWVRPNGKSDDHNLPRGKRRDVHARAFCSVGSDNGVVSRARVLTVRPVGDKKMGGIK